MARFIFNGGTLGNEVLGIQRYTVELLAEIDRIAMPGEVEVAVPDYSSYGDGFKNISVARVRCSGAFARSNLVWSQVRFPDHVRKTGGIGVDTLLAIPLRDCDVVTVFDSINERHPENYAGVKPRLGLSYYLYKVKKRMGNAKVIITDSHSAKEELLHFYGGNPSRIRVVTCGWQHFQRVTQDDSILKRLGIKRGCYFFSLGSRLRHKNFRWVLAAARQNPSTSFVVTGTNSFGAYDLNQGMTVPTNVTFTGYLTDGEVKALMAHCKAFIQPSLSEGFGIPPLEAMSVGARCIVSDIPVFHEIYRDSVWYMDPMQYDGIELDAIMAEPLTGGNEEVLALYSWRESARTLLDALREL